LILCISATVLVSECPSSIAGTTTRHISIIVSTSAMYGCTTSCTDNGYNHGDGHAHDNDNDDEDDNDDNDEIELISIDDAIGMYGMY
jgi:hypothetical protein